MISKTIYKAPGGKMIRISVDHADRKIQNIELTGDFFLYPEESINKIEAGLKDVDIEEKKIVEKLKSIIKKNKITFIGINEYSLTRAILIACGVGI